MKLSALAIDVKIVYHQKKINKLDVLELYREGYISTKECRHILNSKGGKNGIR